MPWSPFSVILKDPSTDRTEFSYSVCISLQNLFLVEEIVLPYALRKHHKGFQPLKIALFRKLARLFLTSLTERRKHTQPSKTQRKDQLAVGIGILRQALF